MTLSQIADINMFRNLIEFFEQQSTIINASPTLKEDYDDFVAHMQALDAKLTDFNEVPDSAGTEKAQLKVSIADKTVLMFGFLRRHALKTNDEPLQKLTEVYSTGVKRMSDMDFIEFCKKIDAVLRQHAAVLTTYAVSAEDQAALLLELNSFKSIKPQVKLNQSKKAVTNEDIAEGVKNIKSLLMNMMDISVKTVNANHPEFVRQYDMNRKRREPAKSVTQLMVVVQNTTNGMPIKGAEVEIEELSLSGVTDAKGQILIKTGRAKSLTGTVSMTGWAKQTFNVSDITRGETLVYTVKMMMSEMVPVFN